MRAHTRHRLGFAIQIALMAVALPLSVAAQEADQPKELESVKVTGSRLKQTESQTQQPVSVISRQQLEDTGLASIGEVLQQLTTGGKALNAKFNSSGNFGYPSDGGGIGAGSAQVDLRHLGSQRVLVLVDGVRWVNESSASGVSGSADLNTIPLTMVESIEILEDGASAIYGSDAIAGVINIITRKNFDGTLLHGYFGEYDEGGRTTEASVTWGNRWDRGSIVVGASYFDQTEISSNAYELSRWPVPFGGLDYGSSATPQGRYTFCDPSIAAGNLGACGGTWFNVTLNPGTTTPVWIPAAPFTGTYNQWDNSDRFNYAVHNLLLTPSERKSVFANLSVDLSENTRLHFKVMFNNRQSRNQAAPEPIFVGPFAGTGGIADTIFVSRLNPFNPFGIDLDPAVNFGWVTRRPVEVGPRLFDQDVDTHYFNLGLDGVVELGGKSFDWDANFVGTVNKAEQVFQNGYNMAHIALALGDPAACAAVAGCVPLDLFGGQGRPMTAAMIDWIRATQRDSSKQEMNLMTANLSGDWFSIGDRTSRFALGFEHRRYHGSFTPDILRQTGESQDSFAAPVSAGYQASELYGELNVPLAESFDVNGAVRVSDYSNFGTATTGKLGFRWQPVEDFILRGTYSEGFRAPNIGELHGLTQFGATLVDPCGPTNGALVVNDSDGLNTTPLETACRAQGVPNGFRQANTQITTFTGGNANLKPEESDSYTVGVVYSPSWGEDASWSDRFDLELTYYNHEISGAIQARDIQALLDECLATGGTNPLLCSPFTRPAVGGGNLAPPNNFLDNLGVIETDGMDIKLSWGSPEWSIGRFNAALQLTTVFDYRAVDSDGNVSSRAVGIEVNDSAIPEWQGNLQVGWAKQDWNVNWNMRYIDSVAEACNGDIEGLPGCPTADAMHVMGGVTYHDLQASWNKAFTVDALKLNLGINNVFAKDPPYCLTCSLNGYDAGTYDLPGRFVYLSVDYKFD